MNNQKPIQEQSLPNTKDQQALFTLSYGLYIVSTTSEEGDAGCIINTATQVTASPVQITVTVNKENVTCARIMQSRRFALSVLDETADMPFIGRFGFRSSADFSKFEGIASATDALGNCYTPAHSCALLSCAVEKTLDCGSHLLFLAQVEDARILSSEKPLTYAHYHKVLKGKTPPKASSYAG